MPKFKDVSSMYPRSLRPATVQFKVGACCRTCFARYPTVRFDLKRDDPTHSIYEATVDRFQHGNCKPDFIVVVIRQVDVVAIPSEKFVNNEVKRRTWTQRTITVESKCVCGKLCLSIPYVEDENEDTGTDVYAHEVSTSCTTCGSTIVTFKRDIQ